MKTQNIEGLDQWNIPYTHKLIISGPCSVESEAQVRETAKAIAAYNVNILRGGIWKPRTRPDSFEGVGEKGLVWLKQAGQENNLPVTVEVANPEHIELCLKHNIDILWIGARTTVNPIAVQDMADTLKGVDIPVMIKNPICPEIDLWLGAIERINRAGIKRIAAIHRGFSSYKKAMYRYAPNWEIPIELKRRIPEVPLICDPSHISGKRELIFYIAQKAMNYLFDGLMIESHINPDQALSDAKQQLTPDQLGSLLKNLTYKTESPENGNFKDRIDALREEIDDIDDQLIDCVSRRMSVSAQIGQIKAAGNISIFQPHRWRQMVDKRLAQSRNKNLSEEFILELFQSIHQESIRRQQVAN